MRVIVGRRGPERQAASTNTMSRFETEVLTEEENLEGLASMNAQWVDGAMAHTPHRRVILDMDSSESPVHGEQEGAAYNGHFGCVCYHPMFVFNQFGDCEGAMLRLPGTSIAQTTGGRCWSPSWPATSGRECVGTSGPTLPSPSRRSMSTWRSSASSTLSGSPATRCFNGRSPLC